MFHTKAVEKIKKHFMLEIFLPENSAVFDIVWEVVVEPDRTHITI